MIVPDLIMGESCWTLEERVAGAGSIWDLCRGNQDAIWGAGPSTRLAISRDARWGEEDIFKEF